MANVRQLYGIAEGKGIDTKGMSPKQVVDALKEKGVDTDKEMKDSEVKAKAIEEEKRENLSNKVNTQTNGDKIAEIVHKYKTPFMDTSGERQVLSGVKFKRIGQLVDKIENANGDISILKDIFIDDKKGERFKTLDEISEMDYNQLKDYAKYCKDIKNKEKEQETTNSQSESYGSAFLKTLEPLNLTKSQQDKQLQASKYREQKYEERQDLIRKLQYATGGYVEGKKSVRAVKSEIQGKYPLSEVVKLLGTTTEKVKKYLSPSEWHHSGGTMYNKVDYYDISSLMEIADDYQGALEDKDKQYDLEIFKKLI